MRCNCILASGNRIGLQCHHLAKPGSMFCGKHKNCRQQIPQSSPVRAYYDPSDDPLPSVSSISSLVRASPARADYDPSDDPLPQVPDISLSVRASQAPIDYDPADDPLPSVPNMVGSVRASPVLHVSPAQAGPARAVAMHPPRLLGSGTYGCVYSPPIKCATPCTDSRCATGVSKLMEYDNASDEYLSYEGLDLASIDPDGKYHIKKPYKCVADLEAVQSLNNQCHSVGRDSPNQMLLLYDNGGIDLNKYIKKGASLQSVLGGLKNIFLGVKTMHSVQKYHIDIKLDNIVALHTGESLYDHFRLIDFGLAVNLKNGREPKQIYNSIYFVWPPDMILLTPSYNFRSIHDHVRHMVNDHFVDMILKPIYSINRWDPKYIINSLENLLTRFNYDETKKLTPSQIQVSNKIFDFIISGVDVYSLGVMLANVMYMFNRLKTGHHAAESEFDFDGIDALFSFLTNSNILNPDPFKRLNAADAYEAYVNFVDGIYGSE